VPPENPGRFKITVVAILRNFVSRAPVEHPLAYFRQVSHEAGWILPIFYYLHLAGQSRSEAITLLKSSNIAKPKSRTELVKLLSGTRTQFCKLGGNRAATFSRITSSERLIVKDPKHAKAICSALTGMTDVDEPNFDKFHELLSQCIAMWEANATDRSLFASIRGAAARLDEIEYGSKVPVV
jgi:hypothetical protein